MGKQCVIDIGLVQDLGELKDEDSCEVFLVGVLKPHKTNYIISIIEVQNGKGISRDLNTSLLRLGLGVFVQNITEKLIGTGGKIIRRGKSIKEKKKRKYNSGR